jgi:hypothetical protein
MAGTAAKPRSVGRKATKVSSIKMPVDSKMINGPRPQYFLTRQNGIMVPLIALDELPATVSIRGVSRILSPYEVAGMQGLGTVESQHSQYLVDGPRQGLQLKQTFASSEPLSIEPTGAKGFGFETPSGRPEPSRSHPGPALNTPYCRAEDAEQTQSTSPPKTDTHSRQSLGRSDRGPTVDDSTRHTAPGVKEYCSYWIRHGECDYAQQGCLYRHEMPVDLPSLKRLGLRDIPRWYREKHGYGSYLALGAHREAGGSTSRGPVSGSVHRKWRKANDGLASDGSQKSVASLDLERPGASIASTHAVVRRWNAHAIMQAGTQRRSCTSAAPKTAIPRVSPSSGLGHRIRLGNGSRLVSTDTETISARAIREANELAALHNYPPLVPQKSESSSSTGPSTPKVDDVDTDASFPEKASISVGIPDCVAPRAGLSRQLAEPAQNTASVRPSSSPPTAATWSMPKQKRAGGRTRNRNRGRDRDAGDRANAGKSYAAEKGANLNREAQRKAVAKAKLQVEGLAKSSGKGVPPSHEWSSV